jgi:transposase
MSRHGVPAKELQRQFGVTYKTAWRMGHEIRKYMAQVDGNDPLSGHVEVDETYIGGRVRGKGRGLQMENKSVIVGMVQRGGELMMFATDRIRKRQIHGAIRQNVKGGTYISADDSPIYDDLHGHGYRVGRVNHTAMEWVRGVVHTNTIEGVWSMVKRSIRGTHIAVSRKHLWKYLAEFEYRWNMRKRPDLMLDRLLQSF